MAGGMYGADVEQLRQLAAQLDRSADNLARISAQLTSSVNAAALWQGPSADRFRGEWSSSHRAAMSNAASGLTDGARSLRQNADEQAQASAVDGSGSGSAAVGAAASTVAGFGSFAATAGTTISAAGQALLAKFFPKGFDLSSEEGVMTSLKDALDTKAYGPVSFEDLISKLPKLGPVTDAIDFGKTFFDPNASTSDKVWAGLYTAVDNVGGGLRDAGVKSKQPELYLAGVAVSEWDLVAKEATKIDFSPQSTSNTFSYMMSNPWDSAVAASQAVVDELPKIFGNFWP